jgi:hypothetical protein
VYVRTHGSRQSRVGLAINELASPWLQNTSHQLLGAVPGGRQEPPRGRWWPDLVLVKILLSQLLWRTFRERGSNEQIWGPSLRDDPRDVRRHSNLPLGARLGIRLGVRGLGCVNSVRAKSRGGGSDGSGGDGASYLKSVGRRRRATCGLRSVGGQCWWLWWWWCPWWWWWPLSPAGSGGGAAFAT